MKIVKPGDLAKILSREESLIRLFERDWCRAIHGVTAHYWLKQPLCEDLEQIAQWCLVDFFNLKHSEKSRVVVRIDDSLNSSIGGTQVLSQI